MFYNKINLSLSILSNTHCWCSLNISEGSRNGFEYAFDLISQIRVRGEDEENKEGEEIISEESFVSSSDF